MYNKILRPPHIEYLIADRDLKILEISSKVQELAECPDEIGEQKNVCLGFPELIGYEDTLLAIIQGNQTCFQLKGIARFFPQGNPRYIDIYALQNLSEKSLENQLIIFLEDVTERMVINQKLVQISNDINLLMEPLFSSRDFPVPWWLTEENPLDNSN